MQTDPEEERETGSESTDSDSDEESCGICHRTGCTSHGERAVHPIDSGENLGNWWSK